MVFESGLANGLPSPLPGNAGVTITGSYSRTTNNNGVNSTIASANTGANQFLEKARFFLTASSRAPDVNLFNQPRVVCWPVDKTAAKQTTFDQTILWCSTIHSKIYCFRRDRSDDPTNDLPATSTASNGLLYQNRNLINYLQNLTSQSVPGFGGDFVTKYDSTGYPYAANKQAERDKILTEIFDYIRSTNLSDQSGSTPSPFTSAVTVNPPSPFSSTPGGGSAKWGGSGQVVPIIDTLANGYSFDSSKNTLSGGTRGFGRFPTVEGATLLFICLGWNDGNNGAWTTNDINYNDPVPSQGDVTSTWTSGAPASSAAYATYPPGYGGYSGTLPALVPVPAGDNKAPLFPAYSNGAALKSTVKISTTGTASYYGTPIAPGCVRVQAVLLLNLFDPSQGYPTTYGTYHFQVSGLDKFTWKTSTGSAISMGFPSSNLVSAYNTPSYTTGVTNWATSIFSRDRWGGKLDPNTMVGGTSPGNLATANGYYPFYSDTIDVPYNPAQPRSYGTNPTPLTITGTTVVINVDIPQSPAKAYSAWGANQPVQTIKLNFPNSATTIPTPYMSWRAQRAYTTTGTPVLRNNFGTRFGNGTDAWGPIYSPIQPQDVTRSVRAYPGDIRVLAGRTLADGTADNFLYDDANQSHFPEYSSSTEYRNHDIWSCTSNPLFGVKWGQLVQSTLLGSGNAYNGSTKGNPWQFNTSLYYITNFSGSTYAGTSRPGELGNGSYSGNEYSLAGGNCPTDGSFITKAGVNLTDSNNNPIQGDFDNGLALWTDGPYINKADEGDFQYQIYYPTPSPHYAVDTPYFSEWYTASNVSNSGTTFFSPNRLMPSPGMFGSLSTGVIRNIAWMTLQFRPFPVGHPGLGNSTSSTGIGPPYANSSGNVKSGPPDHLWMDLFNMPIVEPYPITEPLSTAGRVNMNVSVPSSASS